MNYYIQGSKEREAEIKAAFKQLGCEYNGIWCSDNLFYFTLDGKVYATAQESCKAIIKTHPDYKELELELPAQPNFKVHDWVVDGDRVAIIYDLQKNGYVGHDVNRRDFVCRYSDESRLHLWSIADAKDGDVLATDNGWTCIFKAFDGCTFSSYCFMDSQNWFCEFGSEVHTPDSRLNGKIHPATKEQCDLLFTKMKEAGYEWDADKKELLKIKHYAIANFQPFDKVLVRFCDGANWCCALFSHYCTRGNCHFVCSGGSVTQCIPFNDDTKHLLGTTDMCDEQYINW